MAEYIEREKVYETLNTALNETDELKDLFSQDYIRGCRNTLRIVIDDMKKIPTADVRPERHGVWVRVSDDDQDEGRFICSECKEEYFNPAGDEEEMLPKFCPCCGAKMDGKNDVPRWISTAEKFPPENQIVDTKIDDEKGVRNEQELIYSHNRWFLPDKSMYVYYTPTHWRNKAKMDGKDRTANENSSDNI